MAMSEEESRFALDCYVDPLPDEDVDGDSSEYFGSRAELNTRLDELRQAGQYKYYALYEVDSEGDFELYDEVFVDASVQ